MLDAALAETRDDSSPPPRIRLDLRRRTAETGRKPAQAAPAPVRPQRNLNTPEFIAAIESALEDLRPRLKADGGDCCLVGVEGDMVRVRMSGACVGCQLASMTVAGVRMRLIEKLGFPVKVVPV
jgi:NifU-like protein